MRPSPAQPSQPQARASHRPKAVGERAPSLVCFGLLWLWLWLGGSAGVVASRFCWVVASRFCWVGWSFISAELCSYYTFTALPDRGFRTYNRTQPIKLAKTLPITLAITLAIILTIILTITLTALCNYAQLSTPNQATIFSTLCHLKKNCKYMGYSRARARRNDAPSTERSEVAERSGAGKKKSQPIGLAWFALLLAGFIYLLPMSLYLRAIHHQNNFYVD